MQKTKTPPSLSSKALGLPLISRQQQTLYQTQATEKAVRVLLRKTSQLSQTPRRAPSLRLKARTRQLALKQRPTQSAGWKNALAYASSASWPIQISQQGVRSLQSNPEIRLSSTDGVL